MSLKQIILLACGFLSLGLGAIGLVLPVWPTTPFVLLAAGCFACHPKIYARMMKIPFFSEYIRNYQDKKGLPKKTVIKSLVFLWSMLGVSAFLIQRPIVILLLAAVGTGVTIHILWVARARK